jgi:hypothetical protein
MQDSGLKSVEKSIQKVEPRFIHSSRAIDGFCPFLGFEVKRFISRFIRYARFPVSCRITVLLVHLKQLPDFILMSQERFNATTQLLYPLKKVPTQVQSSPTYVICF